MASFPCNLFYSSCGLFLIFSSLLLHHSPHVDGGSPMASLYAFGSRLATGDCSVPETSGSTATLKIVHRHGPCSPLINHQMQPSQEQILYQDQARADYLCRNISTGHGQLTTSMSATIGVRNGTAFVTSNYIATVGFGTPKKDLSLTLDTGSDLTWVQCQTCTPNSSSMCSPQTNTFYAKSRSSTCVNIPCNSPSCSLFDSPDCSVAPSCRYKVQYADSSTSVGLLLKDTLTLTPSETLPGFVFGCSDQQKGLFGSEGGLLGLGRDKISLVSQASQKYGAVFSYCLPINSAGYLTLDSSSSMMSSNVRFTPMITKPNAPSLYFLNLIAITVSGNKLSIPPATYSGSNTILDSGTVISRLPKSVYFALRSEFQKGMSRLNYTRAQAVSILDTCYDVTMYKNKQMKVPSIALVFDGGVSVDLDFYGILYVVNDYKQACLAFAVNDGASDVSIVGNVQQHRYNVVYDVGNQRIGFGGKACN